MTQEGYEKLVVWQKAVELSVAIYKRTDAFPKAEIYGLTSQMRRASVSIPSNIAEGQRRGSPNEFRRFLSMAFGSGAELETQPEIARRLNFMPEEGYQETVLLLGEIMRMLNKLRSSQLVHPSY